MKKVSIESKKVFLHNRIMSDKNLRKEIDNSLIKSMDLAFELHPNINQFREKVEFHSMMMRFEILPN